MNKVYAVQLQSNDQNDTGLYDNEFQTMREAKEYLERIASIDPSASYEITTYIEYVFTGINRNGVVMTVCHLFMESAADAIAYANCEIRCEEVPFVDIKLA